MGNEILSFLPAKVFQPVSMIAILSIEYFFSSKSKLAMHWINTDPETVSRDSNVQLYMKQHFLAVQIVIAGAHNDSFLLNALKTLFSLSTVLLYL